MTPGLACSWAGHRKAQFNLALLLHSGSSPEVVPDLDSAVHWYREAAEAERIEMSKDDARERIYGIPYATWKEQFQGDATPEQMAAFKARKS